MTDLVLPVPPKKMGELARRIAQRWPLVLKNVLRTTGRETVTALEKRTSFVDAVFTGQLKSGWYYEVRGIDGVVVSNHMPYMVFVDKGRLPGGKRPPVQALIPWVIAKWGVNPADAPSRAFALARSIQKKGIKARPLTSHVPLQREMALRFFNKVQQSLAESA